MNAKQKLTLCVLWGAGAAWANDFLYALQDPLQAKPQMLSAPVTLPGDIASLKCNAIYPDIGYAIEPLSLITAVNMALCHHPQLKSAWAAIRIQASAVGEAKAAYMPTLNVSASRLKNSTQNTDGITPDSTNQGQTRYANLSWRLFDFGTRAANLDTANQLLKAALASHDAAFQKVLMSVTGAYFDVMTAQAAAKARAQAVNLAMATWQTTKRRVERGVAASSDTLQAAATLAKAQLTLNRAQGEAQKTHSVLMYAMGLPTDTKVQLPDEHLHKQDIKMDDLNQWLIEAQTVHPALAAARAQVITSRAKVSATQAEGLPSLDFVYTLNQNGYPNQGLSAQSNKVKNVGFTLSVPFFEGFARTYKVKGMQAQSEQAQAQFEDTQLQVLTDVVKAHADAQTTFESLQASLDLLHATQAALQTSQKRYEKGATDILELLSTQNALADAQQERIKCLSDWRSARLKLLASVGVLGRENLE